MPQTGTTAFRVQFVMAASITLQTSRSITLYAKIIISNNSRKVNNNPAAGNALAGRVYLPDSISDLFPVDLPLLDLHNHINSLAMLAAHKFSVQPCIYDHLGCLNTDYSCTERQDIAVVMLSGKLC